MQEPATISEKFSDIPPVIPAKAAIHNNIREIEIELCYGKVSNIN
jgi:hypothetical protein